MREISKESTLRQRILQLCDYYNISPNKLSADAGYNRNYISRTSDIVSMEFMLHIYRNYEQVNIEWLLTGNGKMLLPNTDEEKNITSVLAMLNQQLERNENQQKEIQELREKLSDVANIAKEKSV